MQLAVVLHSKAQLAVQVQDCHAGLFAYCCPAPCCRQADIAPAICQLLQRLTPTNWLRHALQASTARSHEEAAGKQASLAAQLTTAKEDLAASYKECKQLQQQLADTQDAVKVCVVDLNANPLPMLISPTTTQHCFSPPCLLHLL